MVGTLRKVAKAYLGGRFLRTKSHLPDALKAEVISAARMLAMRSKLPNPVRLLGCKIHFLDEMQFRVLFEEIFVREEYSFFNSDPQPSIIDCGSNIGMSILYFKKLFPRSTIKAFEPDPDTFSVLRKNIDGNGWSDIEAHNCALGAQDGEVRFFRSTGKGSLMASTIEDRAGGEAIMVPIKRLSSFIDRPIDLVKMDIEGSERAVLQELIEDRALQRISSIHLEYHHHLKPCDDNLSEVLGWLERGGFGYQVRTDPARWGEPNRFQDVSIFGYQVR